MWTVTCEDRNGLNVHDITLKFQTVHDCNLFCSMLECEHGYFNEIKAAEQLERSHSARPVMFHKKFLSILSLPVCPESA